jgi:hypothetical protein
MCEQYSRGLVSSDAGSLRDHILRLDNGAEEARLVKIEKLKVAIAEKTYYVSAPDVASKVRDYMQQLRCNGLRENDEKATNPVI